VPDSHAHFDFGVAGHVRHIIGGSTFEGTSGQTKSPRGRLGVGSPAGMSRQEKAAHRVPDAAAVPAEPGNNYVRAAGPWPGCGDEFYPLSEAALAETSKQVPALHEAASITFGFRLDVRRPTRSQIPSSIVTRTFIISWTVHGRACGPLQPERSAPLV
jgi:hypothetical protein